MFGTNFVAWWGAVVATLLLVWDIAKWIRTGPIVRSRIQLNTLYPDGRALKVEKTEHGKSKKIASYCHIELVNVGSIPTTVMGISASHMDPKKQGQMSWSGQRFTPHHGKTLPQVIPPGEVWSCRFEMDDMKRLSERGKPYIEVHLSHKKKTLLIWPKLSANQANPSDAKTRRA